MVYVKKKKLQTKVKVDFNLPQLIRDYYLFPPHSLLGPSSCGAQSLRPAQEQSKY